MYFDSVLRERCLYLNFKDVATRNSLSVTAVRELISHLGVNRQQFDVLCFRAPGRIFCSGGNLSDYSQMKHANAGQLVNDEIAAALKVIAHLPLPTFCLIEGDCFGGGVELLSSFDFVYSVPHAFFGLWQRRIGLTFGWGGGERLKTRLGAHRLQQLSLSTENISAERALTLGLIDRVIPKFQLLAAFELQWLSIKALPRIPIESIKRWSSKREREIFNELWWNDEHRARLKTFTDKA